MKRFGVVLAWATFLVAAGIFLLLKNLGVLGAWGDLVWGGLYTLAGLGFLAWFLFDFARWWRVLPGFTLLSVGGLLLAQWRGVALGDWKSALVILGIGLGFWVILLVKKENWWALIPAGVLTVVGILLGLEAQMREFDWLTVLFFGLGLVFVLLYILRMGQEDTRWAAIPAAALILLGIVTLLSAIKAPPVILNWWPILLIVAGMGLFVGQLSRRQPAEPVVALPEHEEIEPAPGASVSEAIPETVPELAASAAKPRPPVDEKLDIYSVLAQQPAPEPAETPEISEPVDTPPVDEAAATLDQIPAEAPEASEPFDEPLPSEEEAALEELVAAGADEVAETVDEGLIGEEPTEEKTTD